MGRRTRDIIKKIMYETIIRNLSIIASDVELRFLSFTVADDVKLVFDMFEEELYWTDNEGNSLASASQQSVIIVLGSQYGQSSI